MADADNLDDLREAHERLVERFYGHAQRRNWTAAARVGLDLADLEQRLCVAERKAGVGLRARYSRAEVLAMAGAPATDEAVQAEDDGEHVDVALLLSKPRTFAHR